VIALALALAAVQEMRCNPSGNQGELNVCARDEYRAADRSLNIQYRKTLVAVREQGRSLGKLPGTDPAPYGDVLITGQRAWLAYRDAQCRLESRSSQGGSMQPMIEFGCLARLTRERTTFLRKLVEEN
jgi:uncharacterized protein YecT (DUF1311 family)